jgi:hypothetical protein
MKRLTFNAKKGPIIYKDLNYYWPAIFCTGEKKFIAFSLNKTKGRKKVISLDWKRDVSRWVAEYYFIPMDKYKIGEKVYCPYCGCLVDFRFWVSSTEPYFNDQKDSFIKLSNTQKIGS